MYLAELLNFLVFLRSVFNNIEEEENMLASNGAQSVPIGIPIVCLNTFFLLECKYYLLEIEHMPQSPLLLCFYNHYLATSDQ